MLCCSDLIQLVLCCCFVRCFPRVETVLQRPFELLTGTMMTKRRYAATTAMTFALALAAPLSGVNAFLGVPSANKMGLTRLAATTVSPPSTLPGIGAEGVVRPAGSGRRSELSS